MFGLAAAVAAQSRIVPPAQNNSNSGKRSHVATVRSSDSPDGSRVAINSDQSLNNYEAYRRGDRFYVKIPAAEVPRAEAVRGRGFADVKAQRQGDSTVVSFRLQPGATAHVEQRANKLDVVVTVPGGNQGLAANRANENSRRIAPEPARANESNKRGVANTNRSGSSPANSTSGANRPGSNSNKSNAGSDSNSASRTNPGALGNSNSSKAAPSPMQSKATPTPVPTPSAKPSATPKAGASATPKAGSTSSANPGSSPAAAGTAQGSFWARTKERAHYWLLLAQLNPIPVAVGATLLVLIIGLLLFQRRRAKATRRVKTKTKSKSKGEAVRTAAAMTPEVAEVVPVDEVPAPPVVATEPVVAAAETVAPIPPVLPVPVPGAVPVTAPADDPRKERVGRVAEEAQKVFSGGPYDEAIIGSDNPETRRLVGAELASALVGRNAEKRDRARAAFMKHGYFDDATRDLRTADSENERAAAARRLSFVNDPEATPHLVGALGDPAPDVRRAAVEALMDLRDPQAIAPLNSMLQTETDRKVPRNLIQEAIDACATAPDQSVATPPPLALQPSAVPPAPINEIEREVIEL